MKIEMDSKYVLQIKKKKDLFPKENPTSKQERKAFKRIEKSWMTRHTHTHRESDLFEQSSTQFIAVIRLKELDEEFVNANSMF